MLHVCLDRADVVIDEMTVGAGPRGKRESAPCLAVLKGEAVCR
jgi:hypothetical protein